MGSRRPVVGITAAVELAAWAVWRDVEVNVSQRTYSKRIDEAGGMPLVLPPSEAGTADPGAALEPFDALVLTGGADIDPSLYGEQPDQATKNTRLERDLFELALAGAAIERDMPLLGVCRGCQLLNVALGGTLDQHMADAAMHLHTPGQFSDHDVRLEPGSLAARAAGAQQLSVRSHHHQGIASVGDGLTASAWAEPGGAIEAIELRDRRWALGILWHTEEETMSRIIDGLVRAARAAEVTA